MPDEDAPAAVAPTSAADAPMPGPDGNIATAPVVTAKLGSDGEPTPVGNDLQRAVAEEIAKTFRGDNPTTDDVNARIHAMTQDPHFVPPAPNVVGTKPAQIKAQGVVLPPKVD